MAKITLYLKDAQIRSEVSGILTSGMVGVEVKLVCDESWNDLSKTLICRAGDIAKTTFVKDNRAVVAHETMVAGKWLELGVEGRNDDGSVVIPTLWERCCIVLPGVDSSADQTVDPTLPIWMQLQKRVESLEVPHAPSDIGALPTPLAAEVGQYLRVAGVNSIGAVTQVEAVDAPKQNDDAVKTVNGIAPDENGNVQIPGSGGNVDQEQITIAINTALAQAKASGEFDGEDGKDYVLTEADKQEIAQEAAELVEVPKVDIPTTLPNPNALTFTGAATGIYDGSAPLTVNIPAGGGGTGGGGSAEWVLLHTIELTEDTQQIQQVLSMNCTEVVVAYESLYCPGNNSLGFAFTVNNGNLWSVATSASSGGFVHNKGYESTGMVRASYTPRGVLVEFAGVNCAGNRNTPLSGPSVQHIPYSAMGGLAYIQKVAFSLSSPAMNSMGAGSKFYIYGR